MGKQRSLVEQEEEEEEGPHEEDQRHHFASRQQYPLEIQPDVPGVLFWVGQARRQRPQHEQPPQPY